MGYTLPKATYKPNALWILLHQSLHPWFIACHCTTPLVMCALIQNVPVFHGMYHVIVKRNQKAANGLMGQHFQNCNNTTDTVSKAIWDLC